ncbi:bile acid:sodium symporter family protein [Phytomonospora endophytica]|uniref:BASS family bile acid:Na+ symporter n=1 Tax=Phytomonospora endophytica TaxID=714109 RepID=A0A841FK77_9ACTN|nr:bile acid:sodium symporter family protein [Phytomonospora endophytica]MBB6033962.1 BASS family bile acid:Na+ symporter [Phytomonospora endophytica]GIG64517.1 transporter [Phytomonospora endophytica]
MQVISTLLPIALGIVMLGLGLSLTVADFKRVAVYPRATLVALLCQVLLLPAACFGLILLFDPPPALAVGMMLLAASPGGSTANLFSHLFGGDVALNVTLTAVNSVLAVVTLPLVVNFSLDYFMSAEGAVGLQFDKSLQVFAIILIPVALGMFLRHRYPGFADRMAKPVRITSIVVLVLALAAAVFQEFEHIGEYIVAIGAVTLLFNVLSLAVGYWAPRLTRVGREQSIATCMEIGIHNGTLAIAIALSPTLLNDSRMAVPALTYGLWMFLTATAAGFLLRRGSRDETDSPSATAVS